MNRTRSAAAVVVDRWLRPAGRLAAAGDAARAGRSAGSDRAASPVVGVVLVVGLVVIVAAGVGLAGLGFSEQLREPAPNIAESTGELKTQDSYDGGIVRITHIAGDSVEVRHLEIDVTVDAKDGTGQARIVNLPADRYTPTYIPFNDQNIAGDEFISKGISSQQWSAGVLHEDTSNTLSAGSWFEFRIKGSDPTGIELSSGDTVTVRVIHTPSKSVIIEQELTAS